ncbi:unnamed protein product, partial [marine sediment metagenome]
EIPPIKGVQILVEGNEMKSLAGPFISSITACLAKEGI